MEGREGGGGGGGVAYQNRGDVTPVAGVSKNYVEYYRNL